MDLLSNIIREFNERFATNWTDNDRIRQLLFEDLPAEVSQDEEYQNAKKYSDRQNARITHERKLVDKFQEIMLSQTDLYRKFTDDLEFKKWLCDTLFSMDYYDHRQADGH
jgi:type I restriction enzyme R subunit